MRSWRGTFRAVWAANLVTGTGMMSFLPWFPSILENLGLEDPKAVSTWAGLCFGAAPLTATLSAPLWGAVGDRLGRKLMVLRSLLAIALFTGAMAFARTPLQLLLLRAGQGLFSGFVAPSITLASVGAPADRQGRVAGDLQTALALGSILGPSFGGFLGWLGGPRLLFLSVSGAACASALLVAALAHEAPGTRLSRSGSLAPAALLGEFAGLLRRPGVRALLGILFVLQLGLATTNPVLELQVRHLLGAAAGNHAVSFWTSLVFGLTAVANLVALPFWGRFGDRHGHGPALVLVLILALAGLLLQAVAPSPWLLAAGRVVFGAGLAGAAPLAYGMAAGEISVERRGGGFGALFSARTAAAASGAMLGGWAFARLGFRGVLLVSAAATLAVLLRTAGRLRASGRVILRPGGDC